MKRRRDRYQKQSVLLSKLTRQLSIHDNREAASSSLSDGGGGAGTWTFIVLFLCKVEPSLMILILDFFLKLLYSDFGIKH